MSYVHLDGTVIETGHVRGRVTITSRQLRVHTFAVVARQFDAPGQLRLHAARPMELQ